MNIRDTLQGIRYDLEEGSQCVDDRLLEFEQLIDDLGKLKAGCLDNPDRALVVVVEFCDAYGIVVTR